MLLHIIPIHITVSWFKITSKKSVSMRFVLIKIEVFFLEQLNNISLDNLHLLKQQVAHLYTRQHRYNK